MSEKEAWNWTFSRGLPIRMTHKRCLPWKVHSKTWTVVFRIMKLEIFKEITHSYDTQEMFAMKSSLKNLTYGFPNLIAKNILEKLTNDIAQHQTYTTRLTNNFPTRLLSWLPVKLLKLTDTATTTDNGGEGGGGVFEYHSHSITPQNVFSITHDVFSSWKYF